MSVLNNINHSKQQIVEDLQQNVTSLQDLSNLMSTIAHRGDLAPFEAEAFGNIDTKLFAIATHSSFPDFLIRSGPLYSSTSDYYADSSEEEQEVEEHVEVNGRTEKHVAPFSWETTKVVECQHEGQPDSFEFDFVKPSWAWVD